MGEGERGMAVCGHEGVCKVLQPVVTLYVFSCMVVILYFFSATPLPFVCMFVGNTSLIESVSKILMLVQCIA